MAQKEQYSKKDLQKYMKARDDLATESERLNQRVRSIITTIHSVFGVKPKSDWSWWYPDAGEGEVGQIQYSGILDQPNGEVFYMTWHVDGNFDSGRWDYGYSFPTQFLTMSVQEITEYINNDIQEVKEEEKKALEAADKLAVTIHEAKKAALRKLTNEEKKALGLTK